jgi:AcrR family transcriptional regulator
METTAVSVDPGQSTADRILDAAEDLFAQQGYSATSLGDVADRVGIRSPSLYNHFRNKEALYTAVLERLLTEFLQPLAPFEPQPGAPATACRLVRRSAHQ